MNEIENRKISERIGSRVRRQPRVTVVVPVYNVAAYIAETLVSIFAQTFEDYETIVVNDGSTDTSALEAALAPFRERIIYIEQPNAGASVARNTAVRAARGELIAFLDGDDVWLPDFLCSQIEFLEKNDFEMVYSDALIFGETLLDGEKFSKNSPSGEAVTTASLLTARCNVITSGTILKRALIEKNGLFDAAMRRGQDFEMWFRLAKAGARIGFHDRVLLKYRVRAGNLTGTAVDRAERNVTVMNRVREKYEFDETERRAWQSQMAVYEAERDLETGKAHLARREYEPALAHLRRANRFYRQPKLWLLVVLLRCAPQFAARLFKTLRPAEFALIAPE